MNFTFDEETGKGYIEIQPGESADQLSDLLVNLHFDDMGVLVGVEIIPKPDGDYYEGRNDAADDIMKTDVYKVLNPGLNALQALEHLKIKLADIARG
jgi:methylmalonyl-CoA mutase cobalamin-binding subunit